MHKKQIISISFIIIGIFIICLGCILGWCIFPKIVKKLIKENRRLEYGLDMYKNWLNPPFSTTINVYYFNVSNTEEVSKGAKPILKEIGPYAFKKTITRHHPAHFPDIDAIWYEERTFIEFDPKNTGSGLKEDDQLVVIHLALLASLWHIISVLGEDMFTAVDEVFKDMFINYTFFQSGNPIEMMYSGIFIVNCTEDPNKSPMISIGCKQMKLNKPPNVWEEEPSLFYNGYLRPDNTSVHPPLNIDHSLLNIYKESEIDPLLIKETSKRLFLISRGSNNINELGNVKRYMGKDKVDFWGEGECQNIKGTDTTIFHPFLDKKPIDIFMTTLCRSTFLVFKNEIKYRGITAYNYELDPEIYHYTEEKNFCYCKNNTFDNCPINGTIELKHCYDAHIICSHPHFLHGHQDLINFASGIKPDKKKHESYVIIDQLTGIILKSSKRLQYNIKIKSMEGITPLENAPSGIFPVFWIEENFEINDVLMTEVKSIHNRVTLLDCIKWILIALGIVVILVGFYLQWKLKKEIEHHQLRKKKLTEEPKIIREAMQTLNRNRMANQIFPMESRLYPDRIYRKNLPFENETRINKIDHSHLQN